MTEDNEKAILVSAKELERVTCIQYPIALPGPVSALLDSGSKINAMHPAFAERLGLVMQTTNVSAQKIDGTTFETYEMVVAAFSVID